MADTRFHRRDGPFTLSVLAAAVGAELPAGSDGERRFQDVAAYGDGTAATVSYLEHRRYLAEGVAPGAALVRKELAGALPEETVPLIVGHPVKAYARIAAMFYPEAVPDGGVDARATVATTATIGAGTRVDPGAVVGEGAEIGSGSHIGPGAAIGPGVRIGDGCRIGATATISHALVGDRVIVMPGARIGQPGFGFASDASGHRRIPQLGRAVIEDDVEIGANSCVDRGAAGDTVIGRGTIIDNLVHIAHNVRIGRFCVILGQVGISGSTQIDDFVVIAGQAGLSGHIKVGKAARIAAKAGVIRDVEPGAVLAGFPAVPVRQWHRQSVVVNRLATRKGE